MIALEQKFNEWKKKEVLDLNVISVATLVDLVKQLQADRDAWITNAKNWEKENGNLNYEIKELKQ